MTKTEATEPEAPTQNEPNRWSADDPAVIIRAQPTTAVYLNTYDQIVICQDAETGISDDDHFVRFDRHNLPALIAKLKEFV